MIIDEYSTTPVLIYDIIVAISDSVGPIPSSATKAIAFLL